MHKRTKTPSRKIAVVGLGLFLGLGLAAYLYMGGGRGGAPEKAAGEAGSIVTVAPPPALRADPCRESGEKLKALFAYLDRQDYIAARDLAGGSAEHFRRLLARLLASPPASQRETDDLLRVLQNRAHFFRVLGKRDTLLVREILLREGQMTEASLATLYQATTLQENCPETGGALGVPLPRLYPYAVFFLNTLGGSSYLMRRDSRVRLLTRYYSVLVVDRANQQKLNKLGLDIRPPLEILIRDLEGAANLDRKEEYLAALRAVRARY